MVDGRLGEQWVGHQASHSARSRLEVTRVAVATDRRDSDHTAALSGSAEFTSEEPHLYSPAERIIPYHQTECSYARVIGGQAAVSRGLLL